MQYVCMHTFKGCSNWAPNIPCLPKPSAHMGMDRPSAHRPTLLDLVQAVHIQQMTPHSYLMLLLAKLAMYMYICVYQTWVYNTSKPIVG